MSWPAGVRRVVLATTGSTSLAARASSGDGPVWVLAHEQTAARGRRGRPWSMPPGNFAASLAWHPPGTPAQHALRSFAASLALAEALEALGTTGLSLKWPNDVLRHGRKLAGILLEAPEPGLLILGIGVNLAAGPDPAALEPHATPPAHLDGGIGPERLLDTLAPAFAAREAELCAHGFASMRGAWLDRATGLGTQITARLMSQTISGTFETIDHDGHLILATPTGRRTLPAADIHFEDAPCS